MPFQKQLQSRTFFLCDVSRPDEGDPIMVIRELLSERFAKVSAALSASPALRTNVHEVLGGKDLDGLSALKTTRQLVHNPRHCSIQFLLLRSVGRGHAFEIIHRFQVGFTSRPHCVYS
jgi:hypothetical protein